MSRLGARRIPVVGSQRRERQKLGGPACGVPKGILKTERRASTEKKKTKKRRTGKEMCLGSKDFWDPSVLEKAGELSAGGSAERSVKKKGNKSNSSVGGKKLSWSVLSRKEA